jgi:hypothetical protein
MTLVQTAFDAQVILGVVGASVLAYSSVLVWVLWRTR